MPEDLLLFTEENIDEQLKTAPFQLGCYTLRFYTEQGKPVKKVTDTVSEFYLSPSGGTLRDSTFNLVFYDSRFDTYRGFIPPQSGRNHPAFRYHEPIAPYTTIGLGGPARVFSPCGRVDDLRNALTHARGEGIPVQVLAGGSNILFADRGFDGMVVKVDITGLKSEERPDGVEVVAGAGETWDGVVAYAVSQGWGGIECLSGIPGSVGATPVQNVGAYGQEVSETIVSVSALERATLREITFTGKECLFGYRRSRFKAEDRDRFVITAVRFLLRPNAGVDARYPELRRTLAEGADIASLRPGGETLAAVRNAVLALRRAKSMVVDPSDGNSRSVGSFFTNPIVSSSEFHRILERWAGEGDRSVMPSCPASGGIKLSAAWLVEKSGFTKGLRRGGVGISQHHALALINVNGTTEEILALEREIRSAVAARFGVELEREPVVVPPSGEAGA